jgi:hypothetical protein
MFKCDQCGYTTDVKQNYNKHINRKSKCVPLNVHADGPQTHADGPQTHADEPQTHADEPQTHADGPQTHADGPQTKYNNIDVHDLKTTMFDEIGNKYKCRICSKILLEGSLKRHKPYCKGPLDKLQCNFCERFLSSSSSKCAHKKVCKIKIEKEKNINSHNNTNTNTHSLNTNTHSLNNTTTNNNNQVTNNNITIHVNALGNENNDWWLSLGFNNKEDFRVFMLQCVSDKEDGVNRIIKKHWFNDEYPENHNIRKQAKNDDHMEAFDGKEWNAVTMSFVIPHIISLIKNVLVDNYISEMLQEPNSGIVDKLVTQYINKVNPCTIKQCLKEFMLEVAVPLGITCDGIESILLDDQTTEHEFVATKSNHDEIQKNRIYAMFKFFIHSETSKRRSV